VKKSKVCVVIPLYNGKGIVDKCINALLNQTYKPDKIICVDDASPDNSAEYIKEKFPLVKIIKNKSIWGALVLMREALGMRIKVGLNMYGC
jgi:glycosyltransferase involved in cell wall biosynthesis